MWTLLRDRGFLHATAILVGTMVGVGIFGIPFVFAKAGFIIGIAWLLVVIGLMGLVYLLFAELVLSTQGTHQLVGYATIWLGSWGRRLMGFAHILASTGALLAYIIVFGEFAHNILSNYIAVDPQLYSVVFALGCAVIWFARLRTIAAVEIGLIVGYLAVIALISIGSLSHIQAENYTSAISHFWFLPYGVILFAVGGASAVPLQRQLLRGREHLLRPAIMSALAFAGVLYLIFAAVVVGVSGDITSPEALAGLYGLVPSSIILLGSVLGVFTISTSYIALGTALFETYRLDYDVRPRWAWLLTVAPPLIFFWSGLRNFIDVIGLAGAVAGGLVSVLLLAAYLRSRRIHLRVPEFRMRVPAWVVVLLMLVFLAGSVYEVMLR